jgi:GntR family transcriptional regulator, transcriptional repressor for pyruvate dehydrogenase complex
MQEQATAGPTYGIFARELLPERIASRLVSLIAEQHLRPGDKLPPERDLAATMQVSRPSLREALRALAMLNIVEIRQGSGTYVASLRPEVLVEHFDFVFSLDDATFAELLETRRMLEPSLAAAAATRATEADLARLRAWKERCAASASDPDAFLDADLELHQIITEAAHNQIIARFMASLTRLGTASRKRTSNLPGVRHRSLQDHEAIVDALLRRDPEAAANIMRQHLERIQDSLRESFAQESAQNITSGGQDVADHNMG